MLPNCAQPSGHGPWPMAQLHHVASQTKPHGGRRDRVVQRPRRGGSSWAAVYRLQPHQSIHQLPSPSSTGSMMANPQQPGRSHLSRARRALARVLPGCFPCPPGWCWGSAWVREILLRMGCSRSGRGSSARQRGRTAAGSTARSCWMGSASTSASSSLGASPPRSTSTSATYEALQAVRAE